MFALLWGLRTLGFLADIHRNCVSGVLCEWVAPTPGPAVPLPLGFSDSLIRRQHEPLFLVWLEIVWMVAESRPGAGF